MSSGAPRSASGHIRLVYLLFFLSGAAGLIYEMSWSRQIGLLFGHTVNAAAVVLGAYFCGLAVGYIFAARIVPRLRHPLAGYAVAEWTVALWALATPLLLGLLRTPAAAALLNSETAWLQTAIRAAVSFMVLLPATAALGATLPFVAQHVSPPAAPQPRRIALAYGFNTAGAVAGVLAATFVLILYAGVTGSSYIAAAISAGCGLAAWLFRQMYEGGNVPAKLDSVRSPEDTTNAAFNRAGGDKLLPYGGNRVSPTAIYVLAAISGFGTLALQVLYIRLFALTFHNSTYSFGSIVAVYLVALAAASWLASGLTRRIEPLKLAAAGALLGAVFIPFSALSMQRLTGLRYFDPPGGFAEYMLSSLGLIAVVITLPVLLLGLILPALWLVAAAHDSGRNVGRITAVNTLAATAGSLVASFVLLPQLGLWSSFSAFAGLYALTGTAIALRFGLRSMLAGAAALLLLVPQVIALSGTEQRRFERAGKQGYRFLFSRDTPYGEIDVVEHGGERYLRQNRHYTLGATRGAASELLQGALPLQLHHRPSQVCLLGLATGITASAALQDEQVESVVAVELIPEVAEAAAWFAEFNAGILGDPRARIVINDARHYLYATHDRFDVIISDLFVPWHSQTGYLYTVEHYCACRASLAPGGLLCQWLPLYQLSERETLMILDSFASVFQHTYVLLADDNPGGALLAVVGSEGKLDATANHELYLGRWKQSGSPLNTDEHPRVEFLAPVAQRENQLLTGSRLKDFADRLRPSLSSN